MMRSTIVKFLLSALILIGITNLGYAQQTDDEKNLGLSYIPQEIVDEWDEWYTNPTQEKEFIEAFMKEFDVPQEGMHSLNRLQTWYWWVSHHEYEVKEYMSRRDALQE